MRTSKRFGWTAMALAILFGVSVSPAQAGNPMWPMPGPGPGPDPIIATWPDGGRNIAFNPDRGGLGSMTNAEALALTVAAFGQWQNIPSATATYMNAGQLAVDVDETNFADFLAGTRDGLNPIVFDQNGAICDALFGPDSGVLGFTDVWVDFEAGLLVRASVVLNGGALLDGLSPSVFFGVVVHELGHFSGLDHSQVNGAITSGDHSGPSPHNTFPVPPLDGLIETMYPFLTTVGGGEETPHKDDIAMFSTLYPKADFLATTGTIMGRVFSAGGTRPLNGLNVIARNIDNPFEDAVSAISGNVGGDFYDRPNPYDGLYTLNGLTPGARYAVYVDQILARLQYSSVIHRLPGDEEFYNGTAESGDPDTDDPARFSPVTVSAGRPNTGIDIIVNRLRPGPIPLDPYGPFEMFFPFPFTFCGRSYDSFWIGTEGTLNFGPDGADGSGWNRFFNVGQVFLGGPPRIAALLTTLDMNPRLGGTATFDQTEDSLTVTFTHAPEVDWEYNTSGSISFAITLFAKGADDDEHHAERGRDAEGNRFRIAYGDLDATRGVAGYACGGSGSTSGTSLLEPETDVSALVGRTIDGKDRAAVYEEFSSRDIDLDNLTLDFKTRALADKFEPNNSLAEAASVELPFTTANAFSDLQKGDVDFYRFKAGKGDLLVAETVAGNVVDTYIGLFQLRQNRPPLLLATNDDSPGRYVFSQLIHTIPASGDYALAVTAYGDGGFTGSDGTHYHSGRYVLTLDTYRGTILNLGDNDAVKVPLSFAFPFQGRHWNSVWVNTDGNLTFGAGDTATTPRDLRRFLSGPPRIAPFFADLDPTGTDTGITGMIIAEQGNKSLTVHWVGVPRFHNGSVTEGNTFCVRLTDQGDIEMDWGNLSRSGSDIEDFSREFDMSAIVGVTPGHGAADTGSIDLSEVKHLSAAGTSYESFPTYTVLGSFGAGPVTDFFSQYDLLFSSKRFQR